MTFLFLVLAPAQFDTVTRFELGQRLRSFERSLEKHNTADCIKRAVPPVAKATPAFFSGQLGEAARILDTARLTLADPKPDPARLAALALMIKPARRAVDCSARKLAVRVERFYKAEPLPATAGLRLTLANLSPVRVDLARLPASGEIIWDALAEGDHQLLAEVVVGDKVLATSRQTISAINRLDERVATVKKREASRTIDGATRAHLISLVADLAAGKTLETNYPAHRLLTEAEAVAKADKPFYSPARPGQFWLALPGVSGSPVRVEIPGGIKPGVKVPVVVALHGAGGSENMFFDGYGDGLVAKLAARRGWITVATRSGFFGGPDVPAVVDALAKVYPIDVSKTFILGHSMGAAQTAAAAGRSPERFAAAVCLGGGGGVRPTAGLKKLPFFVGVGKLDFAASGATRLADGLRKAGVEKLVYRVYEDVEHLTVVQLALPEVFRFLDDVAKR